MEKKRWNISNTTNEVKKTEQIIKILLENRGLKTNSEIDEFWNPQKPQEIPLKTFGIPASVVSKAIARVSRAIESKEKVVVFGDYDADGVCATAIMWEGLYERGVDVMPYIPDRFSEGYGLRPQAVSDLKEKYPNLGLIITVDNGIVAYEGIEKAQELGIDVIVTDHHQKDKKNNAFSVFHSTLTSGSGLSWLFIREVSQSIKKIKTSSEIDINLDEGLGLVAIGTISDQLPLQGVNRAFVKYGLEHLRKTKKPGLKALARQANINCEEIGVYEVGFALAPRINAAGRLAHAIDSLRLVCTKNMHKANELASQISKENEKRQRMVEEMVILADQKAKESKTKGVLVIISPQFHEGIIGLAASKLVEKFYRPAIVIAQGKEIAKASCRSIPGINIIEIIRKLESYLIEAGGHEMAAGFSISNENIEPFLEALEKLTQKMITKELQQKVVKIDLEIPLSLLTWELADKLQQFEPIGMANPAPVFATLNTTAENTKTVGADKKHLKFRLWDGKNRIDAIAFGFGDMLDFVDGKEINVAYNLDINNYNGSKTLQLKIKDIQLPNEPK